MKALFPHEGAEVGTLRDRVLPRLVLRPAVECRGTKARRVALAVTERMARVAAPVVIVDAHCQIAVVVAVSAATTLLPAMLGALGPHINSLRVKLGIDPVQFGLIFVLNLMIGTITPPVGVVLFVTAKVAGVPFDRLAHATLPYLWALIAVLALITVWPAATTFLPHLLLDK